MADDWTVRPAVPEDEGCIAPMWLRALCASRTATSLGFGRAREPGSDDAIAWWALNQPIVTSLIRTAEVLVLCDPERSEYRPGEPAVLWGWLVTAGDVVYGCGIKNSVRGAGFGREVARALLGDRLERAQTQAIELVDLQRLKLVPDAWAIDEAWWYSMRFLSQLALDRHEVTCRTVAHILDPSRPQWLPSSMRAA